MRILIEEHQYEATLVKDILYGIDALENVEGMVSVNYVGYFYNTKIKDCVFILPKVLLKEEGKNEKVFGDYMPEDIISLNDYNPLSFEERRFIYEFAVWIYRTIVVYKKNNPDSSIVYQKNIAQAGKGQRRLTNTFLDILLALIQFNKDNQNFFFFVLRNIHSGLNKINWTRTISTTSAIIQNNSPIYLNPINKKRQINFDEELLKIFFSILNYIGDTYGFAKEINCNFELIKGKKFETYLKGLGKTKLQQIKYKYFSDKALELWELCYAFFDCAKQVHINTNRKEYLLVKDFNIVFEAIIDELISDKTLPDNMDKKQEDGKIVDHLYMDRSLIDNKSKYTYYIGDSKYYKIGHNVGNESVYKQYTYARNVIQWNLDFFNDDKEPPSGIKLRDDELTEGYNIIPNFFISSKIEKKENSARLFDYADDGIERTDRSNNKHRKVHFKNRLFDRDTLLVFHYDVNFLFIVSLYARNNKLQKSAWKEKVRGVIRKEIQEWLQKDFKFYAMKAYPDVDAKKFFTENFKQILGKVYTPYTNEDVFSLALDKGPEYEKENEEILKLLSQNFNIVACDLGTNPKSLFNEDDSATKYVQLGQKNGVLMMPMGNYNDEVVRLSSNGKMAIGIKHTKEYLDIVANIKSIGYVLLHSINRNDQHIYTVKGNCSIKDADSMEEDRCIYSRDCDFYIVVDLDLSAEKNMSNIKVKKMAFPSATEYDAHFATIESMDIYRV